MLYNPKHQILFSFSPAMQCALGQFFGWQLVFEALADSRVYDSENDIVSFRYDSAHKWNRLIKHLAREAA